MSHTTVVKEVEVCHTSAIKEADVHHTAAMKEAKLHCTTQIKEAEVHHTTNSCIFQQTHRESMVTLEHKAIAEGWDC